MYINANAVSYENCYNKCYNNYVNLIPGINSVAYYTVHMQGANFSVHVPFLLHPAEAPNGDGTWWEDSTMWTHQADYKQITASSDRRWWVWCASNVCTFVINKTSTFTCPHANPNVNTHTEVCMLQPSVIEVVQKNKALMVRKVARRHSEAPLHG